MSAAPPGGVDQVPFGAEHVGAARASRSGSRSLIAGIAANADDGSHPGRDDRGELDVRVRPAARARHPVHRARSTASARSGRRSPRSRTARRLLAREDDASASASGLVTGVRSRSSGRSSSRASCSPATDARSRSTRGWPRRSPAYVARRRRSRWPLGIGVGAITRNPALGITAVLIDMFVLESLVTVFVSEDLGSVLPFSGLVRGDSRAPGRRPLAVVRRWLVYVAGRRAAPDRRLIVERRTLGAASES